MQFCNLTSDYLYRKYGVAFDKLLETEATSMPVMQFASHHFAMICSH